MTRRRQALLGRCSSCCSPSALAPAAAGRAAAPGLPGAIVFVSDRDGTPALYWRRLPRDRERRLTFGSEAVGEPAVSPDGTRVAFSMNGRIGVVAVASGDVAHPHPRRRLAGRAAVPGCPTAGASWSPRGAGAGEPAGLHLPRPRLRTATVRTGSPLTAAARRRRHEPGREPDGAFVVFVREEHLMRVDLADGRVRRLTGGFKRERSPRFLPSGRIACAWSEGKRHGIDAIDADGKSRETLAEGGAFYRTVAPSPDGRFLAATLTCDAGFHPWTRCSGRQQEEVRLLDASGREVARLEAFAAARQPLPRLGALTRQGAEV